MCSQPARVLPTLLSYKENTGNIPKRLSFAFAAMLYFYRGKHNEEVIPVNDSKDIMDLMKAGWDSAQSEQDFGTLVRNVLAYKKLWKQDLNEVEKLSVFLSPLSKEEIIFLKTQKMKILFPEFVKKIMKKKLLRRSIQLNIDLSEQYLENLEIRAADAYHELKIAFRFDYVIPNHDGEDSENWLAFGYPLGDARKAMLTFAELLEGKKASYAEKWEENLVP